MPKITKHLVDAARKRAADILIWDETVKGFGLKLTPKGHKVYLLKYRKPPGGRSAPTRRFTIGVHGAIGPSGKPWTPERARDEAVQLLAKVKRGIDPMDEERDRHTPAAAADGPGTVAELIEEYLTRWARPKKRSAAEDERTLRRELLGLDGKGEPIPSMAAADTWRARTVRSISRRDIVLLLDRIIDRGSPIQANRTLAVIRRMFNVAIERGILDASPCVKIRAPGTESARDRTLSAAEVTAFWTALDGSAIEPNIRHALRFMLATGQRKGEVFGLNEREIDAAAKTWLIPAERAKNGREHLVPLSSLALGILEEARATNTDAAERRRSGDEDTARRQNVAQAIKAGWLFPSARTGRPFELRSPDHAVRDLFTARQRRKGAPLPAQPPLASLPPFTPHDLRRTCATGLRGLGITREDVSLVLNHKDRSVTAQHYDRYDGLREKRRALDTWAEHLASLLRPAETNVTTLDDHRHTAAA